MKVKIIKIKNEIRERFSLKDTLEDGTIVYNVPENIEELKKCALDTIDWEIEQKLKNKANAVNSKLALFAVQLALLSSPDTTGLTDTQKQLLANIEQLVGFEYTDSELAENATARTVELLTSATQKAARIGSATTIEEVVEVLNEDS